MGDRALPAPRRERTPPRDDRRGARTLRRGPPWGGPLLMHPLPAAAGEAALAARWGTGLHAPLRLEDGRALKIIFPGIPAGGSGPDYREAIIEIGGDLVRGDVELHLRAESWRAHGHHLDPAYAAVVLHVVAENPGGACATLHATRRSIPILVMPSAPGAVFPPPFTPPCALASARGRQRGRGMPSMRSCWKPSAARPTAKPSPRSRAPCPWRRSSSRPPRRSRARPTRSPWRRPSKAWPRASCCGAPACVPWPRRGGAWRRPGSSARASGPGRRNPPGPPCCAPGSRSYASSPRRGLAVAWPSSARSTPCCRQPLPPAPGRNRKPWRRGARSLRPGRTAVFAASKAGWAQAASHLSPAPLASRAGCSCTLTIARKAPAGAAP
ncbi:DUF2851 family protein [bacterium]|nr:MAG: DUF2851 family protein [bacterium]